MCKRSERNRRCPTISQTLVYLWIKTQDDLFSLRLPRSSVCFVNSDMPLAWCFVCKLQCVGLSPESGTSLYRRKQNQPHPLFCATQQRSLPPWAATRGGVSENTALTEGCWLHWPRKSFPILRPVKWQVFNVTDLNAEHFLSHSLHGENSFLFLTWAAQTVCFLRPFEGGAPTIPPEALYQCSPSPLNLVCVL